MAARVASLFFCLVILSSACDGGGGGGGGAKSAGTQAAPSDPASTVPTGKAACLTGLAGLEDFLGPRLAGQPGKLADAVCSYGVVFYDRNASSWGEVAPKLRENALYLMNPFCTRIGDDFFQEMPDWLREDVSAEINSAQWGLKFCRAWFDDQYFTAQGTVEESGAHRFLGDHLSLFEPILVAKMMSAYRPGHGVSRVEFRGAAKESVHKAIKTGVVSASNRPPFLEVDQAALQTLLVQALLKHAKGE